MTLTQKRLSKNLTQLEVANKVGITQNTYNNIELGKVDPRAKTYLKICKILGCNLDEIFLPLSTQKMSKKSGSNSKPRVRKTKKSHSTIL